MNEDNDFYIVQKMEIYGGSFVKSLAVCWHHADPINRKKLKETFKNYWLEYSDEKKYV